MDTLLAKLELLTDVGASCVEVLREDRENYVLYLEQIGEAIGQVIFAEKHWKGLLRPDFLQILECLNDCRETVQSLADTINDGKDLS